MIWIHAVKTFQYIWIKAMLPLNSRIVLIRIFENVNKSTLNIPLTYWQVTNMDHAELHYRHNKGNSVQYSSIHLLVEKKILWIWEYFCCHRIPAVTKHILDIGHSLAWIHIYSFIPRFRWTCSSCPNCWQHLCDLWKWTNCMYGLEHMCFGSVMNDN